MAAFGLLAAGIAHEVGNPLTSISSIVQMLERRDHDAYTREKLALVADQLRRIQGILRELINFSRPASKARAEAVARRGDRRGARHRQVLQGDEAAVDHGRHAGATCRRWSASAASWSGVPEPVLNAIDATGKGGRVTIGATVDGRRRPGAGSATTAPASRRSTATGCSSRTSRRRRTAPAWGCSWPGIGRRTRRDDRVRVRRLAGTSLPCGCRRTGYWAVSAPSKSSTPQRTLRDISAAFVRARRRRESSATAHWFAQARTDTSNNPSSLARRAQRHP